MAKLTHPICKDTNCATCLRDHEKLSKELEKRTGNNKVDHLGKYRKYLEDRKGLNCETEWGWAHPFVFEERYIAEYVAQWKYDHPTITNHERK